MFRWYSNSYEKYAQPVVAAQSAWHAAADVSVESTTHELAEPPSFTYDGKL